MSMSEGLMKLPAEKWWEDLQGIDPAVMDPGIYIIWRYPELGVDDSGNYLVYIIIEHDPMRIEVWVGGEGEKRTKRKDSERCA